MFDTTILNNKIESILKDSNHDFNVDNIDNGKLYTTKTEYSQLKIKINPNWVGYELEIGEQLIGHSMSTSEDTDMFELGGKNTEVTNDIFESAIKMLKGFMTKQIYVGFYRDKPALITPTSEDRFAVSYGNRIIKVVEINRDSLKDITKLTSV